MHDMRWSLAVSAAPNARIAEPIRIEEVTLASEVAWDEFAAKCGGSYFCLRSYITTEGLFHRIRAFVAFLNDGTKIAQCAIVFRGNRRHFVDSLQIIPAYSQHWERIMRSILYALGSGNYQYGSRWNVETPRTLTMGKIPGVTIMAVQPYFVHVIDCVRWPNWATYEKAVSNNIRRNVGKAMKGEPPKLVVKHGITALCETFGLTRMRFHTRRRKGLEDWTSFHVAIIRYAVRTIAMRNHSYVAKVQIGKQTVAYYAGIDFGRNSFYIDGASLAANRGGSWLLLMSMIRRAWRPNARILLGMYDPDPANDFPGRENLLLSRRQLRALELPCAIIDFQVQLE